MARFLNQRMSRRTMLASSAAGVFLTSLAAIPATCSGKIYPGTRIDGVDVSGLSASEAERNLRTAFASFEERAITYRFNSQRWTFSLAEVGFAIDYEATIDFAISNGRDSNLIDRYQTMLGGSEVLDVRPLLTKTNDALISTLEAVADAISKPARDASLQIEDGLVAIVDGAFGIKLDIDEAVAASHLAIASFQHRSIDLESLPIAPKVQSSDLEVAADAAARLTSDAIFLTHEELAYPIDRATLANALVILEGREAQLDPRLLAARFDEIAAAVHREPQNVKLGWGSGLYVVADHKDGVHVDRARLEDSVLKLARSDHRTAALPVTPIRAAARSDALGDLGIEDHVAFGSSSFAGSSPSRAENVRVSANNISYQLIAPNGEFSFNDLIGPISPERGFVEGAVINGDFAATDIGGGVCQVSTTVFRAAAKAGFKFVEWHPHTWRLAFYEADGSPPGFDGAIYQPNSEWESALDLRFTNPLDSWLLLQVVTNDNTVEAHFYGRPNGWNVAIGEPILSDHEAVPDPVERVNQNRASGERVQVQFAQPGVTVQLPRTVTAADGSLISEGFFVSTYRSVPDVWESGPDQ